jgi:alkyl hydroperoxide reductase subunit AhpC
MLPNQTTGAHDVTLRLGDTAPDFHADTTHGRIEFHDWQQDSWAVFFSHPRDFTPVCTTELGQLAQLQAQFKQRHTKLLGLSIDTVQSHDQWLQDIRELHGTLIDFPIVADLDRSISNLYGMLHPKHDESFTVRTLFVIDPAKQIRLTLTYPQSCGRNFHEVLRTLDALQLSDAHSVITPAHWQAGDDVIIPPAFSDEEARRRFPKGWRALTPYLRVTTDPRAGVN